MGKRLDNQKSQHESREKKYKNSKKENEGKKKKNRGPRVPGNQRTGRADGVADVVPRLLIGCMMPQPAELLVCFRRAQDLMSIVFWTNVTGWFFFFREGRGHHLLLFQVPGQRTLWFACSRLYVPTLQF